VKQLLHVGCGGLRIDQTPFRNEAANWRETRMDVDANANPDIVASMQDMTRLPAATYDALYSAHNIEHVYYHEVNAVLAGFKHVIKPDGFALIVCPDLQSICALVAQGNLTGTAYMSPAGPISAIDVIYGHRPPIARGQTFMAHKTGFTPAVLTEALKAAGFPVSAVMALPPPHFEIWALAFPRSQSEADVRALAAKYFPGLC
jgi:hypothetical protein